MNPKGIKTPDRIREVLPVLSIIAAVFLWGSSFVAMRIALYEIPPFAVMFCRLSVASVVILPLLWKRFPMPYCKGDWKILVPMVLFQPCLYFLFESNALTYTTSSQAGIISACLPLMVAVGAWFFLSETITKKTIAGLVSTIAGVIFLTLFQSRNATASNPVLGNFLEIAAMASACANMILVKKLSRRYSTWTLTCLQVLSGLVFFLPGLKSIMETDPSVWTPKLILILIYLGGCVSFLAFGLYNWGISRVDASRASIFINLIPVTAVFLGWMVLGETLNLKQSAAAAVVIAGVIYSRPE